MCYFMVVSSILQALFTLGNVTSLPNHYEIKMFLFNIIKTTIFQQRKQHAHCFPSTASPPPRHATLCSTFCQKALYGKAPVDSSLPPVPHALLRKQLLQFPMVESVSWWHGWDALEHSLACFFPEDFCSCFSCVFKAKQREIIGCLKIHSLGDGDNCSLPPWLSQQEQQWLCVVWYRQWEESKGRIC